MVSLMDEAIGNITSALKSHGLYENSLIIFMSDVSTITSSAYSKSSVQGVKIYSLIELIHQSVNSYSFFKLKKYTISY